LFGIAKQLGSPDSNFKKLLKNVIGSGVKTAIMYNKVGAKLSFAPLGTELTGDIRNSELDKVRQSTVDKAPPPLFSSRPGQMDAFGLVQGITYLNASRADLLMWKYFPSNQAKNFSGPFIEGFKDTREYQESLEFAEDETIQMKMRGKPGAFDGDVHKNYAQYASQAAALSDIKSLFRSNEEVHANWDGNQGEGSRVLASGVSSVGDPTKVFTEIHETQNAFIGDLPAPPYAFGDQEPEFYKRALRGQTLYNNSCASCHHRQNEAIYNVGTDPNRAHVIYSPFMRLSLSALTQAACDWGKQRELQREQNNEPRLDGRAKGDTSPYWCEVQANGKPYATYAALTDDLMREYRGEKAGYKADPLYGIWLDAPYLHNGSVPTLRDLFKPARGQGRQVRPATFIRGNPYYNTKDGGFESSQGSPLKRSNEDRVPLEDGTIQNSDVFHTATFDSSLRGNSNAGHEFWHDEYAFDEQTGQWKGIGREWSPEEIDDVIAYLKTL